MKIRNLLIFFVLWISVGGQAFAWYAHNHIRSYAGWCGVYGYAITQLTYQEGLQCWWEDCFYNFDPESQSWLVDPLWHQADYDYDRGYWNLISALSSVFGQGSTSNPGLWKHISLHSRFNWTTLQSEALHSWDTVIWVGCCDGRDDTQTEYWEYDVGWIPDCANYTWNGGELNTGHFPWAIVRAVLPGAVASWRSEYGSPLTVTSGYRNPKHNREEGGEQYSRHMFGDACDMDNPDNQDKRGGPYTTQPAG